MYSYFFEIIIIINWFHEDIRSYVWSKNVNSFIEPGLKMKEYQRLLNFLKQSKICYIKSGKLFSCTFWNNRWLFQQEKISRISRTKIFKLTFVLISQKLFFLVWQVNANLISNTWCAPRLTFSLRLHYRLSSSLSDRIELNTTDNFSLNSCR